MLVMARKRLAEMSKEELWRLFPIELVEHRDVWEDYYKEEEENLLNTLGDAISRIDHIGSTSVPGLLSKPIVDILLQVRPNMDMKRIVEELESAGWFVMYQDIGQGEVDLNKGYTEDGLADKIYHLHVKRLGDWDALVSRDYLENHPKVAADYAALKLDLLSKFKYNRPAYTEAKTDFIRTVVRWARSAE